MGASTIPVGIIEDFRNQISFFEPKLITCKRINLKRCSHTYQKVREVAIYFCLVKEPLRKLLAKEYNVGFDPVATFGALWVPV